MKETSRDWLSKAKNDLDVIEDFFEFAILIYNSVKRKLEGTT